MQWPLTAAEPPQARRRRIDLHPVLLRAGVLPRPDKLRASRERPTKLHEAPSSRQLRHVEPPGLASSTCSGTRLENEAVGLLALHGGTSVVVWRMCGTVGRRRRRAPWSARSARVRPWVVVEACDAPVTSDDNVERQPHVYSAQRAREKRWGAMHL